MKILRLPAQDDNSPAGSGWQFACRLRTTTSA